MSIRVNEHESLTLNIAGAELTVKTGELFKAWMDKVIFKKHPTAHQTDIPAGRLGERYVTSIRMSDGRIRHTFLILGDKRMSWSDGMEWAATLGGDLPDRIEQSALFAFMPDEFQKEAYWSNTQHAGDPDSAWFQVFGFGDQRSYSKYGKLRVRAVRREFSEA